MTNPTLSLLLNYKGSINKHQYLLALVFFYIFISFGLTKITAAYFTNYMASDLYGSEELVQVISLTTLFSGITPVFLPLQFLVFYSVVIISIKRVRALNLDRFSAFLLIVINFLFFNFLLNIVNIFSYSYNLYSIEEGTHLINPEYIKYLAYGVFALGLLTNLLLLFKSANEEDKIDFTTISKYQNLNQSRYTLFIGKMIFLNLIVVVIAAIAAYFFRNSLAHFLRSEIFLIILSVYQLMFFALYLFALIKRFKDSRYSILIPIIGMIVIALITALFVYLIQLHNNASIIIIALFPSYISLISALQFIPFLLPSQHSDA